MDRVGGGRYWGLRVPSCDGSRDWSSSRHWPGRGDGAERERAKETDDGVCRMLRAGRLWRGLMKTRTNQPQAFCIVPWLPGVLWTEPSRECVLTNDFHNQASISWSGADHQEYRTSSFSLNTFERLEWGEETFVLFSQATSALGYIGKS